MANYQKSEALIDADGTLKQLTKKLVERALDAGLTNRLGRGKQWHSLSPLRHLNRLYILFRAQR
ncbi:MAG TPA: hypothetical protein DHW73_12380 [Pseudomonas sp.]|nr:hypothetical protein [Pseudomonadales bacterium]HCB42516.1 hypothetical protein [Pseudomonas sp.]HCL42158.1 hypothetical protein [Pseudomonas sp.]|tara:strand:+ start:641 stop:832 length:192 start_codon:yes stop_codon:yes gene_type:complete